jgi:Trp operon repressor
MTTRIEQALVVVQTEQEAAALLKAVLSERECDWVRRRWRNFELHVSGFTQRKAGKRLHASTTTTNRGSNAADKHRTIIETLLNRILAHNKLKVSSDNTIVEPGKLGGDV